MLRCLPFWQFIVYEIPKVACVWWNQNNFVSLVTLISNMAYMKIDVNPKGTG